MNKRTIITHVGTLILGAVAAYLNLPPKERIVVEERVKYDVRTVTRVVRLPDGTETTDTETTDRTSVSRDRETVSVPVPRYFAAVGILTELPKYKPEYTLSAGIRLAGPFYILGTGTTDGRVGLSVGATF